MNNAIMLIFYATNFPDQLRICPVNENGLSVVIWQSVVRYFLDKVSKFFIVGN